MAEYSFTRHRYSRAGMFHQRGGPPAGNGSGAATSGVALEIYRSGETGIDPLTGLVIDYRGKTEVAFGELILPETVSERARAAFLADPLLLFAAADAFEDEAIRRRYAQFEKTPGGRTRKDADGNPTLTEASQSKIDRNLARTGRWIDDIGALPIELPQGAHIDICRAISNAYAKSGEVGSIHLHDILGNGHYHALRAERGFIGDDFTKSKLPTNAHIPTLGKYDLMRHRRLCADLINRELAAAGLDLRVDHRSFQDQEIQLRPTTHEGPGFHAASVSRAGQTNAAARLSNARKLRRQPEIILGELAQRRTLLTGPIVFDALRKRIPNADEAWLRGVVADLEHSEHVRRLGTLPDGASLFLPARTASLDDAFMERVQRLSKGSNAALRDDTLMPALRAAERAGRLNDAQVSGLDVLLRGPDVSVVWLDPSQSRARALQLAQQAWISAGRPRVGAAPTPMTAEAFGIELGIPAHTFSELAPRPQRWMKAPDAGDFLPQGGILLVEEAEAADLAVLTRLAAAVESKSGKLVLLADPSVMGSMDAGHAVRVVARAAASIDLSAPRAIAEAQKDVAPAARAGRADVVVKALHADRAIRLLDNPDAVLDAALEHHLRALADKKTAFVAVSTQEQAERLNVALRERLRDAGILAPLLPSRPATGWENPHQAAWENRDERYPLRKPGLGRIGAQPPPQGGNRVRYLSEIGLAEERIRSAVLLPGAVRVDVDDGSSGTDHGLRRNGPSRLTDETAGGDHFVSRPGRRTKPLAVAAGDRIVLGETILPSEGQPHHVRAGSVGTAILIDPAALVVRLDDGRQVRLDISRPLHIEHAWTMAVHHAKRADADRIAVALLDRRLDRQAMAKLATRAKERVELLVDRNEVPDLASVLSTLARDGATRPSPEHEIAMRASKDSELVRGYLAADRQAEKILSDIWARTDDPLRDPEWAAYKALAEQRRQTATAIVADKPAHRAAASALRAEWGEIERHAGRKALHRAHSLEALRQRNPALDEMAVLEKHRRLARIAREGLDTASHALIERFMDAAEVHRSLYAAIRQESKDKPSKTHPKWAACERLREGRDRMAALVLKDPAVFRPALNARGRRWRDVERWAAGFERNALAALWEKSPSGKAVADLRDYAQARNEASFERAEGNDAQPHRDRQTEAAERLSRSNTPLLRRAGEIGLRPEEIREIANRRTSEDLLRGYAQAKAAKDEKALVFAYDLGRLGPRPRKSKNGIWTQVLKDAAEFERRIPAQERNVLDAYSDPAKLSGSERDAAVQRWTADPLMMAWIDRAKPELSGGIKARAGVLREGREPLERVKK